MNDIAAARVLVKGRVQGVGFRFFAEAAAAALGLKGWVRNRSSGEVESEVEGPRPAIEAYLGELRKGPPLARVDALEVDWKPPLFRFTGFSIRG